MLDVYKLLSLVFSVQYDQAAEGEVLEAPLAIT